MLKALREHMPEADVVYFGDTANAPYGSKSAEELVGLMRRGVRILRNHGATELVSACNSISAPVLGGFAGNTRIIEMTRPTAREARRYAGKRMLMIATEATVRSRMYHDALHMTVNFDMLPIPALAGAIEAAESEEKLSAIVREALQQKDAHAYDVLLLGCTHYPLVSGIIAKEAGAYGPASSCLTLRVLWRKKRRGAMSREERGA